MIDKELLEKIENKIGKCGDYNNETIPDSVYAMLDSLLYEIDHLEEELKDLKQDLEDNYKAIPYVEQVGISDRDF